MLLNFYSFKKTLILFLPFLLKRGARARLLAALAIILFDVLAASAIPYFAKHIVDGFSHAHISTTILMSFVFLLGICWTLDKIVNHIQEIVFFPVVNTAIRDLTSQVVQHVHSMPMQAYQHLSCAEILSSLKRISLSARSFMRIFFLNVVPTLIKLIVTTVICVKLGLFGLALIPSLMLSFWVLYKATLRYVETRNKTWNVTDKVIMRINDSISNTKLARFFLDFEMQSVNKLLDTEAFLWNKTNIRLHTIHLAAGLILGIGITVILYQACLAVINKTLTPGDFVMLKGQLLAAFLPFKNLSLEFRQMAESVIDIGKIRRVLEIPLQKPPLHITEQHQNILHAKNAIALQNIRFSYTPEKPLLSELFFTVKHGEKIAIFGTNGSGKTSLMGLMSGLYAPDDGQVLINGRESCTYTQKEFHKILHYIPQDLRLFHQTIRENILYGCGTIASTELQNIIELCGLEPLIQNATLGLNTVVGDMGMRLSGGEKQRLALARALLQKPEILLLDETLDALNIEDDLLRTLFLTIPTIILVSHHPKVLQLVDKRYTLRNGKLYSSSDINSITTPILAPA